HRVAPRRDGEPVGVGGERDGGGERTGDGAGRGRDPGVGRVQGDDVAGGDDGVLNAVDADRVGGERATARGVAERDGQGRAGDRDDAQVGEPGVAVGTIEAPGQRLRVGALARGRLVDG